MPKFYLICVTSSGAAVTFYFRTIYKNMTFFKHLFLSNICHLVCNNDISIKVICTKPISKTFWNSETFKGGSITIKLFTNDAKCTIFHANLDFT